MIPGAFPSTIGKVTAYYGHFLVIVILHGTERTGFHTFLAANAKLTVNENDTPIVAHNSLYRAHILTRCVGAMVTINRFKIRGIFNDPHKPGAYAQAVLLFASHLTTMTAHTVIFEIA